MYALKTSLLILFISLSSFIYSQENKNALAWNKLTNLIYENKIAEIKDYIGKNNYHINYQNSSGCTILYDAVYQNRVEIVQYLLSINANPNIPNDEGNSCLHVAACHYFKILEPDVRFSDLPKIDRVDNMEQEKRRKKILQMLIKNKSDINKRNKLGETPIFNSVSGIIMSDTALLLELINAGADMNIKNYSGITPLMAAVKYKNIDAVSVLIEKGADKNIKNNENKTALDIAREQKYSLYRDEKSDMEIRSLLIKLLE